MKQVGGRNRIQIGFQIQRYDEGGTMYRKKNTTSLTAAVCFMVLIVASLPVRAFDVVTIVGQVNPTNQIAVGDEIYEVDDTPQGDDLVKNYIGKKVKVTGKLRIEGDMRIIDVTKFEVVK